MAKEIKPTHGLEVGDCLKAVWGYDQTNVDYYQVVALNGRTLVTVREIAGDKVSAEHNFMIGKTSPIKDRFVGTSFRAKPSKDYDGIPTIRLNSYSYASKCGWDDVSNWTGYA